MHVCMYLSKSKGNEGSRGRTRKVGRKPTKFRDSRDQTKKTRKRKKVKKHENPGALAHSSREVDRCDVPALSIYLSIYLSI